MYKAVWTSGAYKGNTTAFGPFPTMKQAIHACKTLQRLGRGSRSPGDRCCILGGKGRRRRCVSAAGMRIGRGKKSGA